MLPIIRDRSSLTADSGAREVLAAHDRSGGDCRRDPRDPLREDGGRRPHRVPGIGVRSYGPGVHAGIRDESRGSLAVAGRRRLSPAACHVLARPHL